MLEAYIGEDVFRQGIRNYIKSRAYSNAAAADLWNALEPRQRQERFRSRGAVDREARLSFGECDRRLRCLREPQRDLESKTVFAERQGRDRRAVAGAAPGSRRQRSCPQRVARHAGSEDRGRPMQ